MSFEFQVRDRTFRATKLHGIVQVHVLKRVAPVLTPLLAATRTGIEDGLIEELVQNFSTLDDATVEFVMAKAFATVEMKVESGWARIATSNSDSPQFMYEDIGEDALMLVSILGNVMRYNFEPLFREALSGGIEPVLQ